MTPEDAVKTRLFAVYLHRLYSLSIAVRDGCDEVFRLAPPPARDMYIKVDPVLHSRLDAILIDAANIKRLVATNPLKGKNEATRTYNLRIARSEALAALLAGIDISAIVDVKLRNTLEHFDEYLDDLNAKLHAGDVPPAPMAGYNLTLSHREVMTPPLHPLRLYVATERKYYNFTTTVDLEQLRSQANAIATVLLPLLGAADSPGGLMVHLGVPRTPGAA